MESKTILFEDETWKIFTDAEGAMYANYQDSCQYRVSNSESFIIKYLCTKLNSAK